MTSLVDLNAYTNFGHQSGHPWSWRFTQFSTKIVTVCKEIPSPWCRGRAPYINISREFYMFIDGNKTLVNYTVIVKLGIFYKFTFFQTIAHNF